MDNGLGDFFKTILGGFPTYHRRQRGEHNSETALLIKAIVLLIKVPYLLYKGLVKQ